MSSDELSVAQRIIVGHIRTIARLLTFGAGVAVAVLCARLLGLSDVEILGLAAPLQLVWVLYVLLTVAHLFFGWFLVRSLGSIRDEEDDNEVGKRLFEAVRAEDSSLVRGVLPRATPVREGGRTYKMSWQDPTTWLYCGLVMMDFVAILPWALVNGDLTWHGKPWQVVTVTLVGVALVVVNWLVGGQWLVMLSQLSLQTAPVYFLGSSVPIWYGRYTYVCIFAVLLGFAVAPFVFVHVI